MARTKDFEEKCVRDGNRYDLNDLHTDPRITHSKFLEFVNCVENKSFNRIDSKVIAGMIRLTYYCGLTKSELLKLEVRHVLVNPTDIKNASNNFTIVPEFKYLKRKAEGNTYRIKIDSTAQGTINNHLIYLKTYKQYHINSRLPLFPNFKGGKYSESKLQYHLSKFYNKFGKEVFLSDIRQSGICEYYEECRRSYGSRGLFNTVLKFAGCSRSHLAGLLLDDIKKAKKKSVSSSLDLDADLDIDFDYDLDRRVDFDTD